MSTAADKYNQQAADRRAQARIAAETEARLKADPAAQEWLKQFAYDGEPFLEDYIERKVQYLEFGAKYAAHYEAIALRPAERAYRRLWEIQQKKLFNLQCEWRAGRLEMEGLATADDFVRWGRHIHECRLIEPITPEDLELYLAYLTSDDCVDLTDRNWQRTTEWQCFMAFRRYQAAEDRAHEGGPDERHRFHNYYPDWYDFYDRYRGTGYLMRLPVVHTEEGYWSEELPRREPHPAPVESPAPTPPPPAEPPPVRLPHLSIRDKAMTERLLQLVEPPEVRRYWQVMENIPASSAETRRAYEVMEELNRVPHAVPIAPARTWQEAVYAAWAQEQKRELAEHLRVAYAEYCLREELGIAHPPPPEY